jgi:hypothetical protein
MISSFKRKNDTVIPSAAATTEFSPIQMPFILVDILISSFHKIPKLQGYAVVFDILI